MDFFDRFRVQIASRIALWITVFTVIIAVGGITIISPLSDRLPTAALVAIFLAIYIIAMLFCGAFIMRDSLEPIQAITRIIRFVSPNNYDRLPPKSKTHAGKELIDSLSRQVYQLVEVADSTSTAQDSETANIHAIHVLDALPLPLVTINEKDEIVFINDAAVRYFSIPLEDIKGSNIFTTFDMSFTDDGTLTSWLHDCRQKVVTSTRQWERVRIGLSDKKDAKQFDLSARYTRSDQSLGYETMLMFFDHTELYSQDDQAMSFVALSVHELRTPLTLLRGYIEVFSEELGPDLNEEMRSFMSKMDASARQLTGFVNNILNVAKVEDNQLTLKLHKDDWNAVLEGVVSDLGIRARIRGITIKTDIEDSLPAVAVDRYSIYEVLANLIDNAIKYSGSASEVHITSRVNDNGMIATSVKDFGLGIDSNVLPHIFDKFYRNHRNRSQTGGTGLGLYLAKAIIEAHGGQITVNSKVNEGSAFTFTVLPFDKLNEAERKETENGLMRSAHGWIKNHSLYRS